MLLSHLLDHGVLVITVHEDPGVGGRSTLLAKISDLVQAYRPAPVVIILDESAARGAVERKHTWEAVARQTVEVYAALAAAPLRKAS